MVSRNVLGFSVTPNMMRVMECNGFYSSIMRADKKKKDEYGLPLGIPIPCLPVDYLKERPDFWVGGYGSYVCPVDSEWGLWFNWQMNNRTNSSVLVSVKGMNPVTGQRIAGLNLEQYKEKCPVHKTKFKHKRFCEKCGFEWPEQNYISDPTPFYLDGFRTSDGKVRQFYFTEEMSKSIPELVIGRDDTVPAFGFCFYNLKDMKNDYEKGNRLKDKKAEEYFKQNHFDSSTIRTMGGGGSFFGSGYAAPGVYCSTISDLAKSMKGPIRERRDYRGVAGPKGPEGTKGSDGRLMAFNCSSGITDAEPSRGITIGADSTDSLVCDAMPCAASAATFTSSVNLPKNLSKDIMKKMSKRYEVGIGAGEEIDQALSGDKRPVDVWQDKPASVFRIYFVFQEEFERYAKSGFNEIRGEKEGVLAGLPVGGSNE